MPFNRRVQPVRPGEEVRAGVTNRAPNVIHQNTLYLLELIESARLGQVLVAYDQTIETDAVVGDVVWFDGADQRFERALAQTETDAVTGAVVTTASSFPWGMVRAKEGTLADILIAGFDELDIQLQDGETLEAGVYYLSGREAGKLTRQQPGISVPVLKSNGAGQVLLLPATIDFPDRHVHHRFSLTCRPAGDTSPPAAGERHVITNVDDSLPGWLPAGHASFDGNAPDNAAFGYNLAAHPQLNNLWPPLPLQGAYLELDVGDAELGGVGVPLGQTGLAVIDRYGIWWMSDCYDDVPWETSLDTSISDSDSFSSELPECPRETTFLLTLWFSRPTFATDQNVVTSLRSLDSRLTVTCDPTGEAAATGPLQLDLDLELTTGDTDRVGGTAFKVFDSDTETLHAGPVVNSIVAGSENVTVETAATGIVTLEVTTDPTRELPILEVRLDRAQEDRVDDIHFLKMPVDLVSSYRGRVDVPADLQIATPKLRLRFWIMGRSAGTLPALTLTVRRVPRPDGLTPLDLPAADSVLAITTVATLTAANQYVEATSDPLTVVAGDQVFFTIEREDDAYADDVGILDHRAYLASS